MAGAVALNALPTSQNRDMGHPVWCGVALMGVSGDGLGCGSVHGRLRNDLDFNCTGAGLWADDGGEMRWAGGA